MADKLNIKLHICNREYGLAIPPEKEEVYRLAEREVNAAVAKCEKAYFDRFTTQDCLAIVALQLATENIRMSQSREVGNDDVKELNRISDAVSEYLNRLGE